MRKRTDAGIANEQELEVGGLGCVAHGGDERERGWRGGGKEWEVMWVDAVVTRQGGLCNPLVVEVK